MREIKFRGRRVDNGEWVIGNLIDNLFGEPLIDYRVEAHGPLEIKGQERAKVIPETVGQFTGLLDKNKKEIYEGDIVEAWSEGYRGIFEVRWRQEGGPTYILFPAWQNREMWGLHGNKDRVDDGITILGNIYEHSDLLK